MASSRTRLPEQGLVDRVADTLHASGVTSGSRVCLALSGGVDSMVLLDILVTLRPTLGFSLTAAHVHHGLSPHADDWATFCNLSCANFQVPLKVIRVSVVSDDPSGPEAAARRVRHAALNTIETDWLLFAHHQNDQAETLLFRLLRGTGVQGGAAMSAYEQGNPGRVRPLLDVRKEVIEAHARRRDLEWISDESNDDERYTRNFLRHRVLPDIETRFPAAVQTLARAAGHFRESADLLDDLARIDLDACGGENPQATAMLALSNSRLINLLRWLIRVHGGQAPAQRCINEAVRQLRAGTGRPLAIRLGDVRVCVYRGLISIWHEDSMPNTCTWSGERSIAWGGSQVRFDVAEGLGLDTAALEVAGVVQISTRWPGLSMRLAQNRPRKSFKQHCQERGIPEWLRSRVPILRVNDQAAWIAGVGCAAEWQCRPDKLGVLPHWDALTL